MEALTPHVWYWLRPTASSVYALLLWNIGSRHDPPQQEGLLHFLEHTLFKGTRQHDSRQIFSRIERSGGEINAFTTKDKIGIEVRIAPEALPIALDTLHELKTEATFPEREVEKEREVILEELAMYEDIPEESLLDHFEEQVFAEGGLRHPIIGYAESVSRISAQDLRGFYEKGLVQAPYVLLLTGPLPPRQVEKLLKGWEAPPPANDSPSALPEKLAPPSQVQIPRNTQQVHLAIGGEASSPYDWEKSLSLQLLLHELGGGHMTSRLNLLLREKYGWGYAVYAFYHPYSDRSVWGIYAGLTPEALTAARKLIHKELLKLAETPLPIKRLQAIQRSFLGKQALLWESPVYRLQGWGKMLLDKGETWDYKDFSAKIRSLTPLHLQEAAQSAFARLYERIYVPL